MVLSMDQWKGKVAIVTGTSSGIGAAIAESLVNEGVKVVGLARRVERVEELAKKLAKKSGKLYPFKADITKEEEILKAFKWVADNLGPVHILINNAGVIKNGNLSDADTEIFRKVFDTNVMGLCIATKEAVKSMKNNNVNGHIIHMNSVGGHIVPNMPGMNVYPATKHAVTALTETLRQELVRMGSKIKITSISPGAVKTEIAQGDQGDLGPEIKKMLETMPFLESEDVADSVVYVLSTPPHVQVHELIIKPVGEMF